MLVEIAKLSVFLADNQLAGRNITQDQFLTTLNQAEQDLQFAIKALSPEPDGSEAAHYRLVGERTYSQVKEVLEMTKLMKLN